MITKTNNLIFTTVLAVVLLLPQISYANDALIRAQIIELLAQIHVLTEQLESLQSEQDNDEEIERFDWAFVRTVGILPETLYGDEDFVLSLETDGSVESLVFKTDCSNVDSQLSIDASYCRSTVEVTNFIENDGVRTFEVPLVVRTNDKKTDVEMTVSACRFNGCVIEEKFNFSYKITKEFTDKVDVKDRWEFEYEYEDELFHVQEVLVAFPAEDIRRVKARLLCSENALYRDTDDAERIACQGRRTFTRGYFDDVVTDDYGNEFNLMIQLMMSEVRPEGGAYVELELTFTTFANKTYEVAHSPVLWEGDEEDE